MYDLKRLFNNTDVLETIPKSELTQIDSLLKKSIDKNYQHSGCWQIDLINIFGKELVLELLDDIDHYNYSKYKDYLGVETKNHLDIGSGSGKTPLLIHKKHADLTIKCVDVSTNYLSQEAKAILSKTKKITFSCYEKGSNLPYPDSKMGSASLFYVLHHCHPIDNVIRLLNEVHRVLIKDGFLIVIDEPIRNSNHKRLKEQIDIAVNSLLFDQELSLDIIGENISKDSFRTFENKPDQHPGFSDLNFFANDELQSFFTETGFKLIEYIEPNNWNWIFDRAIYILNKQD